MSWVKREFLNWVCFLGLIWPQSHRATEVYANGQFLGMAEKPILGLESRPTTTGEKLGDD